jgi:hypothetical protein
VDEAVGVDVDDDVGGSGGGVVGGGTVVGVGVSIKVGDVATFWATGLRVGEDTKELMSHAESKKNRTIKHKIFFMLLLSHFFILKSGKFQLSKSSMFFYCWSVVWVNLLLMNFTNSTPFLAVPPPDQYHTP